MRDYKPADFYCAEAWHKHHRHNSDLKNQLDVLVKMGYRVHELMVAHYRNGHKQVVPRSFLE